MDDQAVRNVQGDAQKVHTSISEECRHEDSQPQSQHGFFNPARDFLPSKASIELLLGLRDGPELLTSQ